MEVLSGQQATEPDPIDMKQRLEAVAQGVAARPQIAQHVAQLRAAVEGAPGTAVLRPYELADAWQAARREVLILCIEAAHAGVLELQWQLVCPHCGHDTAHASTLEDLALKAQCARCGAAVIADFERGIALGFSVASGASVSVLPAGSASPRSSADAVRVPAADVFMLQEFRELFPAERLCAGGHAAVDMLTLLCTGVRAAPAVAARTDDAAAFAQMNELWGTLRHAIAREQGAVVTMTHEGVTAVFREPVRAVRAVLRTHELLAADLAGIAPVRLIAGVHCGPCIAVAADGRLQYYGVTVDVAVRLKNAAEGGDIVVSDDVNQDGDVAALVRSLELRVTPEEVLVSGSAVAMRLHHLRVPRVSWSRC